MRDVGDERLQVVATATIEAYRWSPAPDDLAVRIHEAIEVAAGAGSWSEVLQRRLRWATEAQGPARP